MIASDLMTNGNKKKQDATPPARPKSVYDRGPCGTGAREYSKQIIITQALQCVRAFVYMRAYDAVRCCAAAAESRRECLRFFQIREGCARVRV